MADRVLLFPGQGAQVVGMARAWCAQAPEARAAMDEADSVLRGQLPAGASLSELCFNGPVDVLNRTDVAQPAIFAASVASLRGLMARLGASDPVAGLGVVAAAGLSLGEYTALHAAGAIGFADGLRLVALRGRAMQEAATARPSGMVALIGATPEQAEEVCRKTLAEVGAGEVLVCANFNAPGQVVISGSAAACARAAAGDGPAAAMGLRASALAVAGAFHSPIMAPAAARLGEALGRTAISKPRCAVVSNVTARPHGADPRSIAELLVAQLTAPVRWSESCQWLAGRPAELARDGGAGGLEFHELAPGKTLAGLMRRISKETKVTTHDEPAAA
jgi:[acyl-carrier-protein] S-malonyltransferase